MNVWNNIWTSNTAIGNFMKNHDIHMTTDDGRWPSTIRASQSGGAMARFDRQFEESLFSDDWWTLWWIMKTRWVVSAGLVEFLFSGDICFFDLKLTNVLNQVSSKRWLRDVHLGVMYEKDTPKWWNGNLTERLGQKAKIEPEVWTFPTPFMLPFWLPFCVGGTTASKSSKRVVPAHVEQNDVSTSSGKTYCRSLFTGFPLLCSCSKVHCPQDGTFCAGSFPPDPQCSGI